MPKIGIRADGNGKIGTGHIVRCLAIAEQLKQLGNEVLFFVADGEMTPFINGHGFETVCLKSEWDNINCETDTLIDLIEKRAIDLLLIDTYFVTKQYLASLKDKVLTAYIDDLFLFDYSVDVLINYSAYADIERYVINPQTQYYMGTSYAPLRSQFIGVDCEKERTRSILILTGGTDPFRMSQKIPEELLNNKELADYELYVVQGAFSKKDDRIENDRVKYFENVSDMAGLMQKVSFAVSAGGTTLYELCACGVPSAIYSFADNQLDNVSAFDRLGAMRYVGDCRNDSEAVVKAISEELRRLAGADLTEIKKLLHSLVDGNGSHRIAEIITERAKRQGK